MKNKMKPLNYYTCDPLGEKFETADGRLVRKIPNENRLMVVDMFRSGMIEELLKKNLIPHVRIADEEDEFIYIEEEKIPYVVYPYEWSMGMLYAAAECILKTNEIALKYGYQLMDPHTYNIVFKGTIPKYVDLGSFQKVDENGTHWRGRDIFLRDYMYPMKIASVKHGFSAPGIAMGLTAYSQDIDVIEYVYFFSGRWPKRLVYFFWRLKNFLGKYSVKLKRIIKKENSSDICQQYKREMKKLEKKLLSYNIKDIGRWSNYHDSVYLKKGDRFDQLSKILQNMKLTTSLEIGGGQGVFSNMLIERGVVQRALVSDYDRGAIDKALIHNKKKETIYFANFNIMDTTETSLVKRAVRFQSDIVIVLAVTHHLILAQKVRLQMLFEILTEYTNKYILIEFMPLGLWDGTNAEEVPEWYTFEWFKQEMRVYFEIKQIVQTERNRIAVLGELK